MSSKRNLKRVFSLFVTIALIVFTNIAISWASSTGRSGVSINLNPPRPHARSGVSINLNPPRPVANTIDRSGVSINLNPPRP